ncbi:MAG: MBL fold metallo-hydrolase [Clostridiales bacterium]|nr:MBL fold metallo-hydrolase [Clostridiales bacterium]
MPDKNDVIVGEFQVGMLPTNFYFLHLKGSNDCITFDPGDDGEKIYNELKNRGLTVKAIYLTHGHFDHIWGLADLRKLTGAPVLAYEGEKRLLSDPELNESAGYYRSCTVVPDRWLRDEEKTIYAGITSKLLATPGHTEGSCCYYIDASTHILISGDTLFQYSVGRTDLPTGSESAIVHSLQDKIKPLPNDTVVYPGHGPQTDLATEKMFNEYMNF